MKRQALRPRPGVARVTTFDAASERGRGGAPAASCRPRNDARGRAEAALRWALCLVGAVACGESESVKPVPLGGPAAPPPGGEVASLTFWQDVAPVYYKRCVGCHREGGIGPFRLDDYASAKRWAAASKEAVVGRRMPPFLATADGSCNPVRDAAWLDEGEIAAIASWADSAMAEGAARADLRPVEPATMTGDYEEFRSPDFEPRVEGGADHAHDEYRCFLLDPQLAADRFVTGYEVAPGNDAIVHHVAVLSVDPDAPGYFDDGRTNRELMRALDDESPDRAGWPCYSAAGDGVSIAGNPVTWAPGQGAVTYPDGLGLRVAAGQQLVMQVHYNLADHDLVGQRAQTSVKLRLSERVEREAIFENVDLFLSTIFGDAPASLPPGQASAPFEWELDVGEALAATGAPYLDLYGVFPHMHERGLSLETSVERADGADVCALDVPRWDFHWQLMYFYDEPLRLGPGDRLRTRCTYDTRGLDAPLTPGWGTENEMCLSGLLLALPRP
ncbi:MAG TPA: hypothetical protein VFS43_09965 [Polyangiaceae bacterium]|nr:hypothetical protein [Polyangiaceae bacterium]